MIMKGNWEKFTEFVNENNGNIREVYKPPVPRDEQGETQKDGKGKCPICGCSVLNKNLTRHKRRVHGQ